MDIKGFIKAMLTSDSNVSSKRVCGVLGWIICLMVLIYCTVCTVQAPMMIDVVLWCCMGLLGIDSITSIWKKK